MNCDRKIAWKILFLVFFSVISISKCQIPASGSDLPSLSSIRWGMSKQELKDRIGRHTEEIGDTALTFPDSFLTSHAHVTLTFGRADSDKGLRFVEIQFDEKNVEELRSYLMTRYGKNYEIEKKEKTKLFFTVNLEASKWLLKSENIIMMIFSHDDEVLALSLLYNRKGR
jgi:hypothetical protein